MHRSAPATLQLARRRSHTHSSGAKINLPVYSRKYAAARGLLLTWAMLQRSCSPSEYWAIYGPAAPTCEAAPTLQRKTPRPAFVQAACRAYTTSLGMLTSLNSSAGNKVQGDPSDCNAGIRRRLSCRGFMAEE